MNIIGVRGAVAGVERSFLEVEDDEETPRMSVSRDARAVEGEPLVWTFSLDRPSARLMILLVRAVAPRSSLPEVTYRDFEPDRQEDLPLSAQGGWSLPVYLDPGELSTTVAITPVRDALPEGSESVALEVSAYPELPPIPGISDGMLLTGTVTDAE